jgi:phosphoglycolate phosphatase-like HAD superfamily hydrolase
MVEKAVLFDVQNTLIKEKKDVSQYYFEAVRSSYGLSVDDIDLENYKEMTTQETVIDILEKQGLTRQKAHENMKLFLEELPYAHYNVAGHDHAVLANGAKEFLTYLHKKGYILGVATGQLERILRNMFDRAGLNYDSYFKFGTYGDADEHITNIIEASIDVAHKEFLVDREHITFISCAGSYLTPAASLGINAIGIIENGKEKFSSPRVNIVSNLRECEKFLK